jgi:hypothetical protein
MKVTLTPVRVTFTVTRADGPRFGALFDALVACLPDGAFDGGSRQPADGPLPAEIPVPSAPPADAVPTIPGACCVWHQTGGLGRDCGGRENRDPLTPKPSRRADWMAKLRK